MSLDNGDLKKIHGALPGLVDQLREGKLDRREFLRTSTLLGLSASAAYALAGLSEPVKEARAASGGTIRFSMRVIKIENPPIYDYVYDSNICRQVCERGLDHLNRTGSIRGPRLTGDGPNSYSALARSEEFIYDILEATDETKECCGNSAGAFTRAPNAVRTVRSRRPHSRAANRSSG